MSRLFADSPTALLLSWGRWLRLRHPTLTVTNIRLPLIGLLVLAALGFEFPTVNMTRELGVVQQVNGLLQILAPFFVAALALVAGFPGDTLDEPVGALQPYYMVAGQRIYPSRRATLSYLFAYLAGVSILLYLAGGLAVALSNPRDTSPLAALGLLRGGWISVIAKATYGALVLHVFAVTLLGLHFLGNFMSASKLARSVRPQPNLPPPADPIHRSDGSLREVGSA